MSVWDHKHALLTAGSRLVVGDELCFSSTVEQVSLTYFLFGGISCKALVKSVFKKKMLLCLLLLDTTLQPCPMGRATQDDQTIHTSFC